MDITNILSTIDNSNNKNLISIFVPSLDREANFKLLTAKQHKDILSTIMDKNTAGITLSLILSNIIKECCVEKINFLVTDKSYILTALRCFSLSKTYKLDETEINLEDVLKNKVKFDQNLKEAQVKETTYTFNISVPSLDRDSAVNRETKTKLTQIADESDANKQALGEVYLNEFMKYINSIEYTMDQPIKINFDDLSFNQKKQIVEKIPLAAATKLIEYSNKLKENEQKFLSLNGQKVELTLDQTFFTI